MKRLASTAFCVLVILSATTVIFAKGPTTKIAIIGNGLQKPVEITDPDVVKNFNVWSGRGTFTGGVSSEFEGKEGFIVDWVSGPIANPPNGLRTYQLSFYTKNDERPPNGKSDPEVVYIVSYAVDPVTGHGYVYLPGKSDEWYVLNTHSIFRGCEGQWFRASAAWQTAFVKAVHS